MSVFVWLVHVCSVVVFFKLSNAKAVTCVEFVVLKSHAVAQPPGGAWRGFLFLFLLLLLFFCVFFSFFFKYLLKARHWFEA